MKLEPTAALVMAMSEDVFRAQPLTRAYFDQLDLSSADALLDAHRDAAVYEATREILHNRKFGVRHHALELLQESEAPSQVVLLAAGKSPLGLELLHEQPARVARVFEVDVTPPEEKAALYHTLLPSSREGVAFITQDILSEGLILALRAQGYKPGQPTLLVMEGITHYITHAQCRGLLARFVSPSHQATQVLLEFAPPLDLLNVAARAQAKQVFAVVEERFFPQGMVKYPHEWMAQIFAELGGALTAIVPMDAMERLRTGRNAYFPTADSGWIELAIGKM